MFPPFDEKPARAVCREMICELKEKKTLCGSKAAFDFNGMFGALVCEDGTVLKAFSGALGGKWNVPGFVPPLFDEAAYNAAVQINDKRIHELSVAPQNEGEDECRARNQERLRLCNETLLRIYSLYKFTCADGIVRNFGDLAKALSFQRAHSGADGEKLLPTGTGDCCGPKLLSAAFSRGLVPVSLAEFFWNGGISRGDTDCKRDNKGGIVFYPPCDEKCALLLPSILGLKILYRDENILVVEKPSGLLSVPGRGEEKQDCVVSRMRRLFTETIMQPSVHRLDMDTSGLMVLAFDAESQRALSVQFQDGVIKKEYVAVLDGIPKSALGGIDERTVGGRIELKFRLDVERRPYQIYDEENGKLGVTDWKRLRIWTMNGRKVTSVLFTPHTGRTHQLRLAAASPRGLNAPIVGDNLYGRNQQENCGAQKIRMMLHASYLSFTHPASGRKMEFRCEPEFQY